MTDRTKIHQLLLILIVGLSMATCSNVESQEEELQETREPDQLEERVESNIGTPALMESASGVEGYLWIGPTCPVVHEGTECPDKPYETEFTITDISSEVIAIGKSDADGFFQIPLPPGSYVFVPESGKPGVVPIADPVPFDVDNNTFTVLEIIYDSGIR